MTNASTPKFSEGKFSVGEELKRARTGLRLSVKEVAQATKIQPWVLEALEADQPPTTMSPIYVKGFLATYARCLRLDPDPLIAHLFPEPVPAQVPEPPRGVAGPTLKDLALAWPLIRRLGTMTIGLAGIVGIIMVNPLRWISMEAPHKEASLSVTTPRSAPSETLLSLQPTQPLELTITARRPTWVQVRVDGRLFAQQQLAAGSQETWKARRRFELIVSTPAHVEVVLNGQSISPLAMAHHGRLVITHKSITPLSDDGPPAPSVAQVGSSP